MSSLDPVAKTARLTAALRAKESERPDGLFTDPLAAVLAGDSGRALADQLGNVPAIAIRTRFYDDLLTKVTGGQDGPRQLVLLAAGMDTRAHRLPFPATTTLYEVDRPELLHLKQTLLTDTPEPACRRVAVGADLAGAWPRALAEAGFRAELSTCWLVEGLTQYLQESDVLRLFDRITACSAPGSHLLADFVAGSLLRDPAARPVLDALAEQGAPWCYGTDAPQPLFTERSWRVESMSFAEVGQELGRWPQDGNTAGGHLVHAVR
ncbi:S-adenosyl-L-methionine-dependent methyltransferase [Streptomyces albospinus]|uniref:S-adenosyl-L-methionine-dependent methyltransferase n=1 Tax=Streptomyces albospinus TaxID=285515 RepID=A0ABQ2VNV6_9ACTN|nr:SAM-dependent methyltransferase [Streptomyces albospinus]GGU96213.1 S-adenosyl-L-methionine-dependent methyltransferase [Streptomyces albospinus]